MEILKFLMRFEVLEVVSIKIMVYRDVMLCSLIDQYERFLNHWYLSIELHTITLDKTIYIGMVPI
jgi:hypothetical protein